jgi:nucleotide-binding universal stress UspA family protein
MTVKNVLVAIDFDDLSDAALAYGREVGHAFGARLHLLHVIENYFMRPIVADPHALEECARQHLEDRLTNEDRQTLGATAVLSTSDHTAEAIVEYANKEHVDLIVIGTHGPQSMERLLMASVAERVVRTAACPVLTVRRPERHGPDTSFVH